VTVSPAPEAPDLRLDLAAPDVAAAVAMTALLADPTRAAVLAMLRDGPHCVCEMSAALGERQNNLSNHLARLRDAGLIRRTLLEADARRVYYERDESACAAALATVGAILGRSS
jgi:ArsR family transcriptional regulator, arsenate/arsenite/antimonite-responsive transcriptional repressor